MALSEKQRRFCEEYLIDLNATQAAIRAGYAPTNADVTGPRMLGKVGIAEYIEELRAKQAETAGVSVQRVVSGLLREAEYEGEGASHSARVSAWEKLGKYLGMFLDKQEAKSVQVNVNVRRIARGKQS